MNSTDRSTPLISVAIATFNRADTLRRALESIASLQHISGTFDIEVVVIDNGSTDHTAKVVASVAESSGFPIRYVYESRAGLPFARNRAVHESNGEWVAFFDDDQLTTPDWLITLFGTAKKENVLCVGGARSLLIETDETVVLSDYCRELLGEVLHANHADYSSTHLPSTGNVLLHRSLFERFGLFDERVLDGGEDADFFNRLNHAGIRCVYDPRAIVQHLIPSKRLERSYLESIAYRHGRHVCRRDFQQRGKTFAILSASARVLFVGVSTQLKMLVARFTFKPEEIVSQACKWRRARGYVSFVLQNQTDSAVSTARTMHRDKG
jgi:glycosyltransferase involved in cell wall biosynthesis